MPAFNEGQTIVEAVSRCESVMLGIGESFEIIVVDDGSSDNTREVLLSDISDNVRLNEKRPNFGKGFSLREGCSLAEGQFICFLDSDLDIDSRGIKHFYSRIVADDLPVDAVIGSKTHKDSVVSYPLGRRVQSKAFKMLVKRMFGLSIGDTQTGLKLFRRELLERCLPHVRTDGFAFDIELLAIASASGFRLVEEPVHVDFQFTSTVRLWTAFSVLIDVLRISSRMKGKQFGIAPPEE
jgi:glycosyltransferase involved in cell wall biosynthesis